MPEEGSNNVELSEMTGRTEVWDSPPTTVDSTEDVLRLNFAFKTVLSSISSVEEGSSAYGFV